MDPVEGRRQRGAALLDALVALLIASTALLSILGGITLSTRSCQNGERRILALIAARSEDARNRPVTYEAETP